MPSTPQFTQFTEFRGFPPRRTLHGQQQGNFFAQHQRTSEPIPSPTILLPDSSARQCHHLQLHPSTQAHLQPVQTMVFRSLEQHKSADNPMLPPLQERQIDNHGCVDSGGLCDAGETRRCLDSRESCESVSSQSYPHRQSRFLTKSNRPGDHAVPCGTTSPNPGAKPVGILPCFSRHQWRERPSRNRGPRSLSTTRRVETIFMDKEHLSPADGLNLTHLVGLGCHLAPLTLQSMATKIPPEPLQPGRDKALVALGGLFGKGTRKPRALRDIAPTQPEQQPLAACALWTAHADAVFCYPARRKQ